MLTARRGVQEPRLAAAFGQLQGVDPRRAIVTGWNEK